jgi:hypothetical protein
MATKDSDAKIYQSGDCFLLSIGPLPGEIEPVGSVLKVRSLTFLKKHHRRSHSYFAALLLAIIPLKKGTDDDQSADGSHAQ